MTAPWTILAIPPAPIEQIRGWFDGLGGALDIRVPADRTPDGVRDLLPDADILLSDWSGALHVRADDVRLARRLAFVQSPSVGLDTLDLPALTAAGIPVANTAGLNAPSVAEWCLAAALAVARSLAWVDDEVRAGRWPQLELPARGSVELAGRGVGVVGFGAVGSRVARLFGAIGCDVAYWSRRRRSPVEEAGAEWRDLDDLVAIADVLVVNVALEPETRSLIDARRIAALPAGAIVIDASRGGIVDHDALLAAVESGALRGAAIDVFPTEPLPPDSPLRRSNRILLSSHAASTTAEALTRVFGFVRDNIGRAIRGEPVERVVNGVEPLVRRR